MGDLRLGQKLINDLRFEKGYKPEAMQRVIFNLEDDEFQKILDITIFAPPSSDLRIANYQKLLNVNEYDKIREEMVYGSSSKKKKRKKKKK